jgi:magnesium transporter
VSLARETAGEKFTTKVPVALPGQSASEVHAMLTREIASFRSINYIYIVDRNRKFIGVLSMKELHRAAPEKDVGTLCKKTSLVTVHPDTHQEKVVYRALKNNIKAIPVVDSNNTFLGSITSDTILTILYKETHEDLLRLAGIRHPKALETNILDTPLLTSFRHRAPWLLLGLLGGLLAAQIIGVFEETLQKNVILAAFIPLIVYMSDAVGAQTEAWVIRDLAIGHTHPFPKYFFRHLCVTLMIAISFGIMLFLATTLLYGNRTIGEVLGLSLGAAITSSVLTGLIVPYIFSLFKLDPADPSGPIGTIMQDILSIVAYLLIASALL